MSIAAALTQIMTGAPASGDAKPATPAGGEAFATLLDAAVVSGETANAAVAIAPVTQFYPTLAPNLHLQEGLVGDAVLTSSAADPTALTPIAGAITVAPAVPSAPVTAATPETATPSAPAIAITPTVTDAALPQPAALPAQPFTPTTFNELTVAPPASTPAVATLANAAPVATAAVTTAETESDEPAEVTAIGDASILTPATTASPTSPIAPVIAAQIAAPVALSTGQALLDPVATAQPIAAEPAPLPEADAAAAPAGEASPTNEPTVATSNRPAPATPAAATQPAVAADAAAPKPDFAALVAAQPAPAGDASVSAPPTESARTSPTPPALQSAPAATVQVYTRILERADGKAQRFEIRLDPAELGRVDVRIEIGADRRVHAVLAAHDSAALSDLMRGQRALERALTDAGIDLADKGVRFELASDSGRGAANEQRNGEGNGRGAQANVWRRFDTANLPATAETSAIAPPSWHPQRLDLVA